MSLVPITDRSKAEIQHINNNMNPLRPKPVESETVLWFEFLLDPNLLTNHLKKGNPDPSPTDLIIQFTGAGNFHNDTPPVPVIQYDLIPGPSTGPCPSTIAASNNIVAENSDSNLTLPGNNVITDITKIPRKTLALKILTLKVATHLKWNLDFLEKNLPFLKQICLLKDLCTMSFGKVIKIPLTSDCNLQATPEGSEKAVMFALTLYHRWVLRLQILSDIAMKSTRPILHNLLLPNESMHPIAPDIPTESSVKYLEEICQSSEPFHVLNFDTFVPLNPNSDKLGQNFESMKIISIAEVRAQIYFDLVGYYLYIKNYSTARMYANECRANLNNLKIEYKRKLIKNFLYCHLDENELEGYLLACGLSEAPVKLMEQLNRSVLNQYQGILEVFSLDNRIREIPLVNRRVIEMDIEGAISQGILKETRIFEMNVAALNLIRGIFECGNIFTSVDYFEKYKQLNCFEPISVGILDILPYCSLTEQNKIKEFLINCILKTNDGNFFIKQMEKLNLFRETEIMDLKNQISEEDLFVPQLAVQTDWKCPTSLTRIEVGTIERQLIACNTANSVRKLLVALAGTSPSKPLWTINPGWQIPTQINSILMSLQRGFFQDFAYVLMGKARELSSKGDYIGAVSMLSVLKSETQRPELAITLAIPKLCKLVTWEILFIQINQTLEEWNRKTLDHQSLVTKCKQCLTALQNNETIIPRMEIIEHCAILLLNFNEWNALQVLEKKRLPTLELPISLAQTFIEMEKLKGNKKISRDIWDTVLSMFTNANKRNNLGTNTSSNLNNQSTGTVGAGNNNPRNSPSLQISTSLYPFLKKIRDQLVLSLTISLLAKIHNILKDDSNFDINGEYMYLWPTSISNPIGYNVRSVSETLSWLLKQALKYYPQNTCWLKLKGDLELSIGNNEAAMKCYVNAIITGTEYCTLPIQRNILDDYIVRKMIKCCYNLGCYMQAAILCQFLDDIDYSLAFKNLSEKSSNFTDSMDAYYGCIWDPTLLEFIVNLHTKKGEHNRKLEAISVMSSLELNANNNEEIKREAAALRKTRFLQSLAKQYLI